MVERRGSNRGRGRGHTSPTGEDVKLVQATCTVRGMASVKGGVIAVAARFMVRRGRTTVGMAQGTGSSEVIAVAPALARLTERLGRDAVVSCRGVGRPGVTGRRRIGFSRVCTTVAA